jgi:hypothetical protein
MKPKRRLLRVAGVVLAGSAIIFAAGWMMASILAGIRPARITVSDVEVRDRAAALADAHALIADRMLHPRGADRQVKPKLLPKSLRIPGLRYAVVFNDHLDLVLARNAEESAGARIWAEEHRLHHDLPTPYRDIFFYRYKHKQPESPDNVR